MYHHNVRQSAARVERVNSVQRARATHVASLASAGTPLACKMLAARSHVLTGNTQLGRRARIVAIEGMATSTAISGASGRPRSHVREVTWRELTRSRSHRSVARSHRFTSHPLLLLGPPRAHTQRQALVPTKATVWGAEHVSGTRIGYPSWVAPDTRHCAITNHR